MSKFVVGQMVGCYGDYIGVVDSYQDSLVRVLHWDGKFGLWYQHDLQPYEEGTDVWPDFIREVDDEQFEARCRSCQGWFKWEEEWGLTEEAYAGVYCWGSDRCVP